MNASDKRIASLLRQIATQDVVELRQEASVAKRVAAQAYVAEQYGFSYGEAWREGHNKSVLAVRLYRDPRPEARAREAATIAAHPEAGMGGPVPGLKPGTLSPLPEAEAAVAVLKDRIGYDVMAQPTGPSQKRFAYAMIGVVAVIFLAMGKWVEALAVSAVLAAFLAGAFRLSDVRRQRIADRLTAAGLTAVTDEHGRRRFLPPGQQLPGHANPFA
ncbi:hypothetical protein [Streptomyces sp. t39]|uniref:hypothetical protein n=1 Tax=Streptomyces sp. t39 TaxID=1828156 RepID=UPI0011CE96B1|nr:hypothetical protein [Streptomyces sp. t39]